MDEAEELTERGWLDSDGYPTDAALAKVKSWEYDQERGWNPLLCFVEDLWRYQGFFRREDFWAFAITGGWSGNEDLIGALQGNYAFWGMSWSFSSAGGFHAFRDRDAESRLAAAVWERAATSLDVERAALAAELAERTQERDALRAAAARLKAAAGGDGEAFNAALQELLKAAGEAGGDDL